MATMHASEVERAGINVRFLQSGFQFQHPRPPVGGEAKLSTTRRLNDFYAKTLAAYRQAPHKAPQHPRTRAHQQHGKAAHAAPVILNISYLQSGIQNAAQHASTRHALRESSALHTATNNSSNNNNSNNTESNEDDQGHPQEEARGRSASMRLREYHDETLGAVESAAREGMAPRLLLRSRRWQAGEAAAPALGALSVNVPFLQSGFQFSRTANMPARDGAMPAKRPISAAARLRRYHEQTANALRAAVAKGTSPAPRRRGPHAPVPPTYSGAGEGAGEGESEGEGSTPTRRTVQL